MMRITDKLKSVDDEISINLCDNGYVVEARGESVHEDDGWVTAKVVCNNLEQVYQTIRDITELPRT
jgi:hypothetical protein